MNALMAGTRVASFERPRRVTSVARRSFIKRFCAPGPGSGIVCFNFWELVAAAGCPYRCSYCFLQATPSYVFRHYPLSGAIFRNWRQMLTEVEEWLEAPTPRMLVVGELQDALAFEEHYRAISGSSLTQMLLPLFAQQTRHRLLFLTKSSHVEYALGIPPTPQVVFAWSLNAEEAARRWEVGAPPPHRRLAAARYMASAGWPIRFRVDPMIPFPGWEDGYARLYDQINEVNPEMVTLGCLRASNALQAHARRNGRDASVFDYLAGKDPGGYKKRLPTGTHVGILRFACERLDRDRFTVALCKEHKSVWKALGLRFGGCNCLLARSGGHQH